MVCVRSSGASGIRARLVRGRLVALGIVAAAVGVGGVTALPARAATAHRAAVVVEVDGVIHTAKVTFSTDSISGLDALRSAGFDPLTRVFGGNGGAVCALDIGATTIGCPADNTCLTCDAPRYWAYFRAVAGATQYTYSVAGAGLTKVHDGDVEAWAWGTGSPPSRFVSFDDVWGSDPPPTTRPPATTPTTSRPPTSATTVTGLSTPTPTEAAAVVEGLGRHDATEREEGLDDDVREEGIGVDDATHQRRRHGDRRREEGRDGTRRRAPRRRLALRARRVRRDPRRAGRRHRLHPSPAVSTCIRGAELIQRWLLGA